MIIAVNMEIIIAEHSVYSAARLTMHSSYAKDTKACGSSTVADSGYTTPRLNNFKRDLLGCPCGKAEMDALCNDELMGGWTPKIGTATKPGRFKF